MASFARPHSNQKLATPITSIDRTKEFNEVCSFLGAAQRARLALPTNGSKPETPQKDAVSLVDFHQAASSMSQEVHTTTQKIAELSNLVLDSSASLFNDESDKISSYVHSISEDLSTLNGKLDSASSYVEQKRKTLGKNSQVTAHSLAVVQELKTSLARASKSFKQVVQQRTNNVKKLQERKKEFGQPALSSRLQRGKPKVYNSPAAKTSLSAAAMEQSSGSGSGGGGGGGMRGRRQQMATTTALIPEDTYYESRAAAVTDIEAHILELGNVFGRVGELVADQQELTERLHENTQTAVENVEASHSRLMRTWQQLSSGRALTMKLGGVLFSFLVFFIVFLA